MGVSALGNEGLLGFEIGQCALPAVKAGTFQAEGSGVPLGVFPSGGGDSDPGTRRKRTLERNRISKSQGIAPRSTRSSGQGSSGSLAGSWGLRGEIGEGDEAGVRQCRE